MPCSLYVHRTDGTETDFSPIEFAQALAIFERLPWKEDVAAWKTYPPETSEEHRPLFTLLDDAGNSVLITAYSDDLLAFV